MKVIIMYMKKLQPWPINQGQVHKPFFNLPSADSKSFSSWGGGEVSWGGGGRCEESFHY